MSVRTTSGRVSPTALRSSSRSEHVATSSTSSESLEHAHDALPGQVAVLSEHDADRHPPGRLTQRRRSSLEVGAVSVRAPDRFEDVRPELRFPDDFVGAFRGPDRGRSSGCVVETSTMTVDGRSVLIRSAAAMPPIPGMPTSIRTMSGPSSSAAKTASSPESASPTRLSPEAASTRRRRTTRKVSWSSTASTPTKGAGRGRVCPGSAISRPTTIFQGTRSMRHSARTPFGVVCTPGAAGASRRRRPGPPPPRAR